VASVAAQSRPTDPIADWSTIGLMGLPASGQSMVMNHRRLGPSQLSIALGVALTACGGAPETVVGEASTTDASTTTGEPAGDSGAESPAASSEGGSSSSADTGEADTGAGFIVDPDGGTNAFACDLWAQDCPEGEKCMPYASDGGAAWDATRCSPLDASPAQVGDACAVDGSPASGVDDCELASACWNVDAETNMGTCVAFCQGSPDNPVCDDPRTVCTLANGGALTLCLPTCDPLLQECTPGEACYPVSDTFACAPDFSGEEGAFGDPCGYINACDPGLLCLEAGTPDCAAKSCCTSFCDTSEADASAACPGAAGGQECVPWYEPGQAPPGYEFAGACLIPE
jgi:hypothetical protein